MGRARKMGVHRRCSFYSWAQCAGYGSGDACAKKGRGSAESITLFDLAGMKRRPNGGSVFKAASRELARVVLDVTRIVAEAAIKSRGNFGIFRAAVYFSRVERIPPCMPVPPLEEVSP